MKNLPAAGRKFIIIQFFKNTHHIPGGYIVAVVVNIAFLKIMCFKVCNYNTGRIFGEMNEEAVESEVLRV
jgi:hypothetical protein